MLSADGLSLSCSSWRVYPEAKCDYYVTINGRKMELKLITTYSNVELPGLYIYYNSTCSVFISKLNFSPGAYTINVTMYPNVTGTTSDISYGKHTNLSLKLEHPSVILRDCPGYVDDKTEIQCECYLNDAGTNNYTTKWTDAYGNRLTESSVLTFTANNLLPPDYHCKASNILGWESNSVSYRPTLLYPPSVRSLTVNGLQREILYVSKNAKLLLTCAGDGFPQPDHKLYNGPSLLREKPATQGGLYLSHTMTCQSFNLFTCSASQNGNNSTKNITVYVKCPPQLTKESKATLVVDAELCKQSSIAFEIYGYPEPNKYTIVKNGALPTHFSFVNDGSTSSYLYNIAYTLTNSPYGLVNLSFVILDHSDFTTYILIIDNNGSQALNYTFQVQEAVTVGSFHTGNVILLLAIFGASAFLGVAIVCRVKQYKRKNPVLYDKPMSRKIHNLEERSTQDDTHTEYLKVIDRTSDEGQEYPGNSNMEEGTHHYESIDSVI